MSKDYSEMEKRNFIDSYYLLEDDLKKIFQFVEPTDKNLEAYSHKIRSLFLLACTEFEANCKSMMRNNGIKISNHLNIEDYTKFLLDTNHNYRLLEYSVMSPCTGERKFQPFDKLDIPESKLQWYKDYNKVKHDRIECFDKATLINTINATIAVYIILNARFEFLNAASRYHKRDSWDVDESEYLYTGDSLFRIKFPAKS